MNKQLFTFLFLLGANMIQTQTTPLTLPSNVQEGHAITVRYRNWRGETAERKIIPIDMYWGSTDWHKEEQWLLKVWDLDRKAERVYALQDIQEFIKEVS